MRTSNKETLYYTCLDSTPQRLLVCWSDKGLCALYPIMASVEESLAELKKQFRSSDLLQAQAQTEAMPTWMTDVQASLKDPANEFNGPFDLQGTEFQKQVWQALLTIPLGQTRSYRQIAEQVGRPNAVRAVGTACGSNPISILIPCHRVIRSDGSYQGYHWGIEMKTRLLAAEAGFK